MHTVITIGREFGSGGRDIGKALAKDFAIPYYDKELLSRAAKDSGICEEVFESHDERPTSSFLYSLVMDSYSMGYMGNNYSEMPINQKIFLAQFDAIKKIAEEGPCVIIGRCADYALENHANLLSIFIHGDLDARIKRVVRDFEINEHKAKDLIAKTDKRRASYYNYYSNKKWGNCDSYDLAIDSVKLGVNGSIELIKAYIRIREELAANNTKVF
ncbi:MAG: cytidylate kinase-like family protein [Lachnospiraceae bacterium]|nr:cytidylate kinase-like family protein [Lachnospiraceae bacterium]